MSFASSHDLAEQSGVADPETLPAFQAIVTWYELRTTVRPMLGDRLTTRWSWRVDFAALGLPPAMHADVAAWFSGPQLVALATFGALMVATKVLNSTLELPVDDYAGPLRRSEVF